MESPDFFKQRETRFHELATSLGAASDFHAIRVDVDVRAVLSESSGRTCAAMTTPAVALDDVYAWARRAGRAGRLLLDGEPADRWIISGGPDDDVTRATLLNQFKAEAMMAAVGADLIDPAAADHAKLEAWLDSLWLDLLLRENRELDRQFGGVMRLAQTSAAMCRLLKDRAYGAQLTLAELFAPADSALKEVNLREETPATPAATPEEVRAARRFAFVDPRLKQKGLSVNGWAEAGQFDPNTGYRYLAGHNVSNESRLKMATLLGVDPTDLPE